ncbi:hypothetical protein CYLTODRAFT_420338 [Cylindrobasidium torrendii FP15055 ss-10]|uniref:C2H2-type domain-containing protein n=1 Tax=Cylindrobasidium torrendii FP15055 ss-10 TaxID=1314674 RepID=A0A0D7BJH5_9AGAR|nr:hypothetical protein CYLTODRAFT_420338 [Cylindrobasidium torrendii FP15055 ss-10]
MHYQCNQCSYTTPEAHIIRRHRKEAHTNTARQFPCRWPGCLYVAKRREHLERHQRSPCIRHVMSGTTEPLTYEHLPSYQRAELGKRKRGHSDDGRRMDERQHRPNRAPRHGALIPPQGRPKVSSGKSSRMLYRRGTPPRGVKEEEDSSDDELRPIPKQPPPSNPRPLPPKDAREYPDPAKFVTRDHMNERVRSLEDELARLKGQLADRV